MASAGKWLYLWNYFNQTRSSRREVNDATQPICVRKVGWMNTWLGQISNHPSIDGSIPYRVDRGRHFVCRMYINIYIYICVTPSCEHSVSAFLCTYHYYLCKISIGHDRDHRWLLRLVDCSPYQKAKSVPRSDRKPHKRIPSYYTHPASCSTQPEINFEIILLLAIGYFIKTIIRRVCSVHHRLPGSYFYTIKNCAKIVQQGLRPYRCFDGPSYIILMLFCRYRLAGRRISIEIVSAGTSMLYIKVNYVYVGGYSLSGNCLSIWRAL